MISGHLVPIGGYALVTESRSDVAGEALIPLLLVLLAVRQWHKVGQEWGLVAPWSRQRRAGG